MNLTKKLKLMMVIMFCMPQFIQASSDLFDQHGKTELMNYIIKKESEIKVLGLENLFDLYFYNKKFMTSSICVNGHVCSSYDSVILRKMYTTDDDVAKYKIIEDEFNLLIEDVLANIKIMVLNGADLQLRDQHGKSAIDYCNTKEIFTLLRQLGAPLSLVEQGCVDMMIFCIKGTAVVMSAMILINCAIAYLSR